MSLQARARDFYRQQKAIAVAAALAARNQVTEAPEDAVGLAQVISRYQFVSATRASQTMAEQAGRTAVVQPAAFVGRSAAGFVLTNPAQVLIDDLSRQIEEAAGELVPDMLDRIERLVMSEVADAGRQAASVEIVSTPVWTNYVRVLNPPSCPRCAILAGRIYRDNDGFFRHPGCDCQHWPVTSWDEAHDEGLVFSAKDAFEKGQITGLSAADAKAIRDGADISQVVNAMQGMSTASIFGRDGLKVTLAGTTKRSAWRKLNPDRPIRLRPESIYDLAKDREDEIRLLKLYGFIKADADIPTDNGRGGGSGGGLPPAPPSPAPEPDDWPGRQAALAGEIPSGLTLEPHEIEFLERLDTRDEQYQWLRTSATMKPTNDFLWKSKDDLAFELKSPKARKHTIFGRIEQSVIRATRQQVVKENFVIDLGHESLTDELRDDLAGFNVGRRQYRIKRLWVMSDDGASLQEIELLE